MGNGRWIYACYSIIKRPGYPLTEMAHGNAHEYDDNEIKLDL